MIYIEKIQSIPIVNVLFLISGNFSIKIFF